MLGTLIKQPADQRDYDVLFERWIPDGDAITTATAVVTEIDPLTDLIVQSVHVDVLTVKVWVNGGINGTTYKITVTVATSGGRIKEEEFKIRVRDY